MRMLNRGESRRVEEGALFSFFFSFEKLNDLFLLPSRVSRSGKRILDGIRLLVI